MRWYTVLESWESVKGEGLSLGDCKRTNFFLFFFPSDVFFLSFSFPHEANKKIFKDVRAKIFYTIDFFLNFYHGQIMIYLLQK